VKAVHYGEGKPPAELFSDPVIGEVNFSVMDKRLILADDVVSTGKTLKKVKGMLLEAGAKRILSVALYVKPSAMHIPDLFAEKEERCLLFPWER